MSPWGCGEGGWRGSSTASPSEEAFPQMHRGNVGRGLCPAWLGGFWDARRPLRSSAWHCRASGHWCVSSMQGHNSSEHCSAVRCTQWGSAGPWVRAQVFCEPRAWYRGSQEICQGHCPPRGSFYVQVAACQVPQSPDQPAASRSLCSLCLPPPAPGQLWANSPWHFLPGKQPVQPGTLVAGRVWP